VKFKGKNHSDKPSHIFSGTLRVKSLLDRKTAAVKGREQVSIAYKMTPHDQSSNAYVISSSSGGEYNIVPPNTLREREKNFGKELL
jgi:hypothetical protein